MKQALITLLDGYNEEHLKTKAKEIPQKVGKHIASQFRGRYDFEAVVDMLNMPISRGFKSKYIRVESPVVL